MRLFGDVELQAIVPHLIDNQQVGLGIFLQPPGQGFFIDAHVEITNQRRAGGVENAITFLAGDERQAAREMALAGATVANKQNGLVSMEKFQRRQIHDEFFAEAGLKGKIEIRQQLERLRQFGLADAVGNAALLAVVGFELDDVGQKIIKARVLGIGFLDQVAILFGEAREPQRRFCEGVPTRKSRAM